MAGFAILAFVCGIIYIWLGIPKTENMTSRLMENKIVKNLNQCGGYLIASVLFAIFAYACPSISFKILSAFMSIGFAVNFFSKLYDRYKILSAIAFVFNSIFWGIGGYFLFENYWNADAPLLSKIFFIAFICVIGLISLTFFILSLVNLYDKVKEYLTTSTSGNPAPPFS